MRKSSVTEFELVIELIEGKDYCGALSELEKLRTSRSFGGDQLSYSNMYYLLGKCLYFTGEYRQALLKAKVALRFSKRSLQLDLFAKQKNLLGLIYVALGKTNEAIEAYTESYAFMKVSGVSNLVYAPLVNLGLANFVKGNLTQSQETLKKALAYIIKHNGPSEEVTCKLLQSRVYLLKGGFSEVSECLSSLPESGLDSRSIADRANVRAMESTYQLAYERALQDLHTVLVQHKNVSYKRGEIVCLEYLGLNEYFAGNYEEAKGYYFDILSRNEITASARAQTLRMLTDVHIAQGDFDKARETATQAEEAITRINERIEMGALYRCWAQIYARDNDNAAAHDYFDKSIRLLNQIGARYELALTYLTCGRSPVYSDEERRYHLLRARDLFVEMDVPKRVVQVDDCLLALGQTRMSAAHKPRLICETRDLSQGDEAISKPPVIIAQGPKMRKIMEMVERIKDSRMTILLTGETGTGKDLLAKYIHMTSHRCERPFQAINLAMIPETLIESELFGCRKGVFTGAAKDQPGLIESTDGGTFFLNEIGEIPPAMQVKLLDVLETGSVRRLGENNVRKIDVRFIVATNRDLRDLKREGCFRNDLYHRLQEFPIHLPPLRERHGDMPHLVKYFMSLCGIDLAAFEDGMVTRVADAFGGCHWNGNVRELENSIKRAVKLWNGQDTEELINILHAVAPPHNAMKPNPEERLLAALERNNGNKAGAARELGMPTTTFKSQLERFNKI